MDQIRIGIPTSSQIWKLQTLAKDKINFGAPALTYIKQKRRERKLKTNIDIDTTSHSLSWGRVIEGYYYDTHGDLEYTLESNKTDVHSSGLFCGTKDLIIPNVKVGDIKCPFARTSFCDLVEIVELQDIEFFKSECPEYYWQLVSNAILTSVDTAELIVFMPYASEYTKIIEYIDMIEDFELQKDIQWVLHCDYARLPMLPDDSEYKNINRFEFKVPELDKQLLLNNVKLATNLIENTELFNGYSKGECDILGNPIMKEVKEPKKKKAKK